MKKLVIFLMASFILAGAAYAQQDPQDPGLQDSLILESREVDSVPTSYFMRVFARTDDSIAFINFPITWITPGPGIHAATGALYFPPLTSWDDVSDSLLLAEGFLRVLGWADTFGDDNPYLHTNYARTHIMSLRFVVENSAPRQLAVIDSITDPRNGPLMIGLNDGLSEITPGFQFGFLAYGVGTDDQEDQLPTTFTLNQNFPNPFNPETNIDFTVPATQNIRLEVYSLLGQKVKTLVDQNVDAGPHTVRWDGTNDNGLDVPSGVYFYRLSADTYTQTNKMVLVR